MICFSLWPWRSSVRTCSRRSTARSAFESASVWFWQTRQRSSAAIASMRFSSTGSAAAGAASLANAPNVSSASSRTDSSLCIQVFQDRLELGLQELRRQRPDMLEAHDAALVDDEGLGHAVDAEVDSHPPVLVENRQVVPVA